LVAAVTVILQAASAPAAVKELANDSFTAPGSVTCQIGFAEGESGAAKLTAEPGDYPYRITKARFFVCPAATSGFVVLRISEDNSGTALPGAVLYEEIVQVTGSDDSLNEVDLSAAGLVISEGSVRLEVEFFQSAPPGLAHDTDGYVPGVNFIYAIPPGAWYYANVLGVVGDWIIRLEIDTEVETPIFADGFEDGTTDAWAVVAP
jgi:hypothetical protein